MRDRFLGVLARWALRWLSRRRLPQTDGRLALPGLSSPVEVLRDRWGVPHVYAASRRDLVFAQGFIHAQDRLWQMELARRVTHGRLSELFGAAALDVDRAARTFGFHRIGAADWARSSGAAREIVLAYTAGVNAFLDGPGGRRRPVELTLLRGRPAPWRPEDTTSLARFMAWQLSHGWQAALARAELIRAVGPARAHELDIRYPDGHPVTLPDGIERHSLAVRHGGGFLERGQGSNCFVVAPARSATAGALLSNDVHLGLAVPAPWYTVHLESGTFRVTGASLPGSPLVLIGHNARVAWGITLAYTDCEDLFEERFDLANPRRYLFRGEWLDAEVREERIRVRGRRAPVRHTVVETRHGPVISDVAGDPEQRIAVQSMALRPADLVDGFLRLNQAAGWDDFVEAMRRLEAPQLNVCYADVDGNIGHWVTGTVPVRARGDGRVPVPGWTGDHDWVGEVPFEQMPHALNPRQGYIVSCNHRIVGDDYPHYLGDLWMNGYRARRIEYVLRTVEPVGLEHARALQLDVTCIPGKELVRRLEGLESADPDVRLALERLREWDGKLTPESVGGALYEVTRHALVRNIVEPALGASLTRRWMGQGFDPVLLSANEFFGHDTVAVLRLLDRPESWWLEQAGGRDPVIERSLKHAVRWLRETLGPDPDDWRWGWIHSVVFTHPLGLRPPLDRVFNRGPFAIGGDTDTPLQTAMAPASPYDVRAWAPSYRILCDLSDWSRCRAMHAPGQSGHLGSPHYDDLIRPWLDGEYHPLLWTRAEVEREATQRLLLVGT